MVGLKLRMMPSVTLSMAKESGSLSGSVPVSVMLALLSGDNLNGLVWGRRSVVAAVDGDGDEGGVDTGAV